MAQQCNIWDAQLQLTCLLEVLVGLLFDHLLLHENRQTVLTMLLDGLPQTDQRKLLFSVLNLLATKHLTSSDRDASAEDYPTVWAVAGALKALIGASETRKTELVGWLTDVSGAGIGESCAIRRAALATLAHDKEAILSVLEKTLSLFGDQLYIRHSPMLQQEGKYIRNLALLRTQTNSSSAFQPMPRSCS